MKKSTIQKITVILVTVLLFVLVTAFIKSPLSACAHHLGDHFSGGIIFYVDNNCHGLIAAEADLPNKTRWSLNDNQVLISTTAQGIYTGDANTTNITNVQGATGNYAAALAKNYTAHGITGWYLPSEDELDMLFHNAAFVGWCTFYTGPSTHSYYWSSTQSHTTINQGKKYAQMVQFGPFSSAGNPAGTHLPLEKFIYTEGHVRPIRKF